MSEDFTQRATCECYYKFENSGDLGEDNQNQIDLTNVNAVTQSADIPSGAYASPSTTKSADFESDSTQYLEASHNDSTELDDITAFTALMWAKLESEGTLVRYFWDKSGYGLDGHQAFYHPVSNYIRFTLVAIQDAETVTLSTATWYFLAYTYSIASDKMKQYKGDESTQVTQLGTDTTATDKTINTDEPFRIGQAVKESRPWDGLICEAAFFSEELSLAEIQEIQADGMEGGVASVVPFRRRIEGY